MTCTEEQIRAEEERSGCFRDQEGIFPTVFPASWNEQKCTVTQRYWFVSRPDGPIGVMAGLERHGGRRWMHLSVSRRNRLPSWEDLKLVKKVLAGPERQAIQVIPRDKEYVNIHPNCLHLFVCLDDDPVPSFMRDGAL